MEYGFVPISHAVRELVQGVVSAHSRYNAYAFPPSDAQEVLSDDLLTSWNQHWMDVSREAPWKSHLAA
jgi:hypothetical protein